MLVHLGVFKLPSSSKGEKGQGNYRSRSEVSLIDLGYYIVWYSELQRDAFKDFIIILYLFNLMTKK